MKQGKIISFVNNGLNSSWSPQGTVSLLAGHTISRLPEHESHKPVPSPPFPQLTATTKLKKNSTYFTKLVPHPILNELYTLLVYVHTQSHYVTRGYLFMWVER